MKELIGSGARAGAGLVPEDALNAALDEALRGFLVERRREACDIHPRLGALVDELTAAVTSGGKRLRPMLATWGHLAAGGKLGEPMVRAAGALELLHTFALIQDDVIDRSETRRGRPASHVTLAGQAETGDRGRFGDSAAILLGDLALIWAERLLRSSAFAPERLLRGMELYDELRSEVTLGQYLDVLTSYLAAPSEEDALRVNRFKTATYTVQRPIQLGMALAGAPETMVAAVPAYAVPAGIAFQLRDDLLGAFGDPEVTGKPSGEDLRERKPTWLWARTVRLRPEAARLGPGDVAEVRELMTASGAVADAEAKIRELAGEALAAARALPVARAYSTALVELTERLVWRTS